MLRRPTVEPVAKMLTADMIDAFEACSTDLWDRDRRVNLHTDADAARLAGLDSPVASAMISVACLNQMLRNSLGERWTRGGELAVAFIGSLKAGDVATAEGVILQIDPDLRIGVRCLNQDRVIVTAGEAVVRGDRDNPRASPPDLGLAAPKEQAPAS
jgi:acyl dehydratase